MLTTLLITIVLALVAANAYLFFRDRYEGSFGEIEKLEPLKPSAEANYNLLRRHLKVFEHQLEKTNAKLEYAFKRLDKLEKAITKNGYVLVSKEELNNKLERLEDFRREATIVIEAMKEKLKEEGKKRKKPKKAEQEDDIE